MVHYPLTIEDLTRCSGEFRAGGTELMERYHLGLVPRDLVDLRNLFTLNQVETIGEAGGGGAPAGGLRLGARLLLSEMASHDQVRRRYPALAEAAGMVGTERIRTLGTLGGNLLQRVRCKYFRSSHARCLKKGGEYCYARVGDHRRHVAVDLGPCAAPHPSTLAVALLAYDARVETIDGATLSISELFGDGSDPTREHRLSYKQLLTHVILPPPQEGERAAFIRYSEGRNSEWPLVEAVVRVRIDRRVREVRVAAGGVANIPLRLKRVEQSLLGLAPTEEVLTAVAASAADGMDSLPMTGYKLELLKRLVFDALNEAVSAS
jgi:xanthine dehydrogenase YagS FAD-binding subunit